MADSWSDDAVDNEKAIEVSMSSLVFYVDKRRRSRRASTYLRVRWLLEVLFVNS